jgi:hypothetical protein
MEPKSEYIPREVDNILKDLDDDGALQIIRLSTASNDLMSNHKALSYFPDTEKGYFFYNSISIVREVAKMVPEISKSELINVFSSRTKDSFEVLKDHLLPFNDDSLSKSALKPIRDVNFHYSFPTKDIDRKVSSLLQEIKANDKLLVGVNPKNNGLLSIRYLYADWFRNEYINSHLSSDLVNVISTIAVEIIAFLDSLQVDIIERGFESL